MVIMWGNLCGTALSIYSNAPAAPENSGGRNYASRRERRNFAATRVKAIEPGPTRVISRYFGLSHAMLPHTPWMNSWVGETLRRVLSMFMKYRATITAC